MKYVSFESHRWMAQQAHSQQVDKAGQPYIEHIDRVVGRIQTFPGFIGRAASVAVLHDILEDGRFSSGRSWTAQYLLAQHVDPEVVWRVIVLTRLSDETYIEYIDRILASDDPEIFLVKLADLSDNMDPRRSSAIPTSLRTRYAVAKARLLQASRYFPESPFTHVFQQLTQETL